MSGEVTKNPKNTAEKPEKKKKVNYPKASIKWTPNPPVIHEDQIVSSVAREKNIWGFIPTYEYEKCHMNYIMNGEYGRQWFKERAAFEKETYTKEKIIRMVSNNFNRKFVQKMMSYKRPTKCSWLESRNNYLGYYKHPTDIPICLKTVQRCFWQQPCHHLRCLVNIPSICFWDDVGCSRFRDWNKLSKDEKVMIKLRETRYKVSKDCLEPDKQKKQLKEKSAKCVCNKEEQKDVKCVCNNKT